MKPRKFVIVIICIIIIATLVSCNSIVRRTFLTDNTESGYRLLINGSEKKDINFNNSQVELLAGAIGEVLYYLFIDYELDKSIKIHKDDINIEHESKTIKEYYLGTEEKEEIKDKNYEIYGNGKLTLRFVIQDAEPGDTIRITAPDFITYNGDTLSLGELILVVGNKVEE